MITATRLAVRAQRARLLRRLDDDGRLRPLAHRPDHLDVVAVADERDEVAAVGVAAGLRVHLRDERADGVDDLQAAALAVLLDRRRDAVRGEDADRARRDLVLGLDEDRAEPLEPAQDVVVVDDRVADVDRRAVLLEQPLDDLDRAVDAGAERARGGEQDAPASRGRLQRLQRAADVAERAERRRAARARAPSGSPSGRGRPSA